MARLLTILALAAAALGAAAPFAALALDGARGHDAWYLRGYADPAVQTADADYHRILYDDSAGPVSYYGEPLGNNPERIVIYDSARLETAGPGPAAGAQLYRIVDGHYPWQTQSVFVLARILAAALLFGAGALLLLASLFPVPSRA